MKFTSRRKLFSHAPPIAPLIGGLRTRYITLPKEALPHDWAALKACCMKSEEEFLPYGINLLQTNYPLIYKDNGSNVLAVAHLDSCESGAWCEFLHTPATNMVFSPALDDRLGVYVITHLLPAMGINVDVLLTTGEEIGQSSGGFFHPAKKYNWMFQFDRMGTDVVTYEYADKAFHGRLQSAGFNKIDKGMFSDISFMEHVGCKGFNVGTAYYDYHSPRAYADLDELDIQVRKLQRFYTLFKDSFLSHTERRAAYSTAFKATKSFAMVECWACYTMYEADDAKSRCPACNQTNPF